MIRFWSRPVHGGCGSGPYQRMISRMVLIVSALVVALQNQAKAGPTALAEKPAAPAVDRSAEAAVRALFAESGSLRGVHVAIDSYAFETEANRYDDDSTWNLWIGDGGRFRVESSSNYWG